MAKVPVFVNAPVRIVVPVPSLSKPPPPVTSPS